MIDQHYGAAGLTGREYQILELVAQGYSAKEVAQRIDIAPRTVERHIDNVRLKLQARNRTHMVAKAIAAQILSIEGRRIPEIAAAIANGRCPADMLARTPIGYMPAAGEADKAPKIWH
ncbi:helix-turn-helix transcriptional regulator [Sphingomonas sp. C3-2]|uniref:helix-turn-helix domain-containing protein n=1 Tax=Sphingomonas sp. C3-2 TaxID=3062169 RepID=UPI00294B3ADA|nr:helix-turn-helix transcriptional regulator [Sphingomonas sp. C3-2]WOK35309.1 helix-turn-helix transcriptional regulator [Sphingomonas sp. C3-2]